MNNFSNFGRKINLLYEKFAIQQVLIHLSHLSATVKHLSEQKENSIYDFEIYGFKFDVKYSNPHLINKERKQNIWTFDLRKKNEHIAIKPECDFYVLLGLINGKPERTFLVPTKEVPNSNIRISIKGLSKYHKYEI
jgi:hypothetical protein